jgi:hypothetical protein
MAVKNGDAEPKSRKLGSLAMVWRYAARYPGHIALALLALIVSSGATIAIPYGFKRVIDRGFAAGGDPAAVSTAFYYLLMIVAVLAVATAFRFYFVSWLGERTVGDIRRAVHANLVTLAPRFFEENRPSEIASRMTSDTAVIEQIVGTTVSVALRNTFTGIGGIVYLFILSPKLAGFLMFGIPLIVVPIVLLGRKVRTFSRDSQDRIADVGAMAAETLGAMKIVQAFGQEARERSRFAAAVEATARFPRRRTAGWAAVRAARDHRACQPRCAAAAAPGPAQLRPCHLPLPDPAGRERARRLLARNRPRPDRRGRRPLRRGQVHAPPACPALLRSAGRRSAAGRRRPARGRSRRGARAARHGPAGNGDLRRLRPRQSALWPLGSVG